MTNLRESLFSDSTIQEYIDSVKNERWFPVKSVQNYRTRIIDRIPSTTQLETVFFLMVELKNEGRRTVINLPTFARMHSPEKKHRGYQLFSSLNPETLLPFLRSLPSKESIEGVSGSLTLEDFRTGNLNRQLRMAKELRVMNAEQTNTSFVIDERIIGKVFRTLVPRENLDIVIPRDLYRFTKFRSTPMPLGQIYYRNSRKSRVPFISFHEFVANEGDYWTFFTGVISRLKNSKKNEIEFEKLSEDLTRETRDISELTSNLHNSLAEIPLKSFQSERYGKKDIELLASELDHFIEDIVESIDKQESPLRQMGDLDVEKLEKSLEEIAGEFKNQPLKSVAKQRVHGDYHLGQILKTHKGPMVIDFEGEPLRSVSGRREKSSPIKDVAGVTRSIDYAVNFPFQSQGILDLPNSFSILSRKLRVIFLKTYWDNISKNLMGFNSYDEFLDIVRMFELDKAVYELNYEIRNRPSWAAIPLKAIEKLSKRRS